MGIVFFNPNAHKTYCLVKTTPFLEMHYPPYAKLTMDTAS